MENEELEKSPVIRMAGSDGHTYETTADKAHDMALAARDEGVQLKAFIKTKDAEGNVREISPFDGAALKEAEDRGDKRYVESAEEPDYFSAEALKAGAARFAIGVVNPYDWLRGIGTAAGTVFRGFAKGVVGTGIKALQGGAYLGESITNGINSLRKDAVTDDDNHQLSNFIGKVNEGFEKAVDFLTPDLFEASGEYDGIEGAKKATGAVKSVAEMVANVNGIGTLTKVMQASGATAKAAHAATGALFGAGKYGEVTSDENGPGGAEQQVAALVAGAADAVIFGLWNPFKIGAKYLKTMKPFMQATRMEAAKRFLAQATNSGLSMAAVEAVKQGAEVTAGNLAVGTSGENRSEWSERTMGEVMKSIGAQFLVGSAFVAIDPLEQIPGRIRYRSARKSQGDVEEGWNDKMRVAMSYQVERNRKDICPKYHAQAVYAYNRFVKQGGRAEGFKEGLSQAPDVRRVNDDGSVVFDDGSVWRMDPRTRDGNEAWGATITVSDGTVLSESGELLGYRPRREATQSDRVAITNDRPKPDENGSRERMSIEKPESNALLMLQQIDEGKLPVADIAIGDIDAVKPTENGNEIAEWDAAKAKPIIVFEDYEGGLHAVTGGKRLVMATAAGEKSIKAVIVREADGWTHDEASKLNAIENLREGHATMKNIVEAAQSLGIDQVSELTGWHQKMGSGEFASKIRRGLAVVQKATPELKDALIAGTISEDFAYNAAQTLSMERVGEGWEAAQKAVAELIGKVGPDELEAVLWGLRERMGKDGASGGPAPDWGAAIAEERAKYNARKGGKAGQIDSDAVLIETDNGELKTLGEMEADLNKPVNGSVQVGNEGAQTLYRAAEEASINKAAELRPVDGEPGTFSSLSHPEARITIDGSTKTIAVDGISVADFEPSRIEQTAALIAKVEAQAATHGLKIGFYDDSTRTLWETVKKNIRLEGHEAYSAKRMEAKRQTLIDHLSKSGLAAEVVDNLDGFNKMLTESGGEPLKKGEEIYGFVDPKTKKVYLNPEFFKSSQAMEAPLHEFGHLGVIACEKTNKAVYDKGMKLAAGFLDNPESAGNGAIREIVDMIRNDRVYSKQGKTIQAEELLAQLIGKRGSEALKAETDKSVIAKVKSWLVEFWNGFGKALGLKDITPEETERMTLEDVADAIRAEMLGGGKYGEGFRSIEFTEGGARTATKPERVKDGDKAGWNYVSFRDDNIRVDHKWTDGQLRFSVASPVERRKDLIAFHNVSAEGLRGIGELGGLAVPSFAITKDTIGGDEFGEISLLVRPETIDPKRKGNKIYSNDAWTPAFPKTTLKINSKAVDRIRDKIIPIFRKPENKAWYNIIPWSSDVYTSNIDTLVNNADGNAVAALRDLDTYKAAYLAEKGKLPAVPMRKVDYFGSTSSMPNRVVKWINNDAVAVLSEKLGDRLLPDGKPLSDGEYKALAKDGELQRKIAEIVESTPRRKEVRAKHKSAKPLAEMLAENPLSATDFADIADAIEIYREDAGKQTPDRSAAIKALDEAIETDRSGYEKWLGELADGITDGKRYIRNNRERYTQSGRERSFSALYDPLTLATAVKSMLKQQEAQGNGSFGRNPFGVAARKYGSLDEVRADEGRLQKLPREQIAANKKELTDRLDKIIAEYNNTQKSPDDNPFVQYDRAVDMMMDAYAASRGSKARLAKELNAWGYKASDKLVNRFMAVMKDMSSMPEDYFEAKAYRAVGFDEIAAAIVPDSISGETNDLLSRNRIAAFTYKAGDSADRLRAVNEAADKLGDIRFSRAVKPSALGDGKQRYYEVPFDKAVDKIVKNKKPVSDEHVFISETPDVFREIGLPSLPVMMNQSHVLSCYFGQGEGVKAGNMHGLGAKLKSLPKAIAKPMMVIANDSNPSSSVIAIVKMQDRDGHTVIAPVEINGIGRSNAGPITANIVKSAFGKKNLWSEKVAKALRDEVDGKVAVFYIDSNEARQISNRLAREAFNFGKSERQLLSVTKGTVHSIADFGSPVKGVGAQKDSRQFKNWFAGSKVVDANGEPLVVYRRDNDAFTVFDQAKTQQNDAGWLGKGFYFYGDKGEAERATGYGKNLRSFYLKAENPYYMAPEEYNRLVEADDPKFSAEFTQRLKDEGYDSVYWNGDMRQEWMVLDANQVKSATDNIGSFDPGNNDIRFSRGGAPEAEYVKLTRVADDAGAGERTPGAMAASAELSRTKPTPITTKGMRYVALPVSEMAALARYLNVGHAQLLRQEAPGGVSLKHKKLWIAADVLGTVDKTDMAAEKEILKRHGFFQQEDPGWLATHSPTEARRERFRSEDALSARLEALADRRIAGKEPGGFAAGRKVFADQLAKVVMSMPHGQPGVLGAMQTVGGALEKRIRGDEAEADAFIGWMKGETTPPARSAQERKAEMFAAFLMMPQEMQARAPRWYDAMRSTIAGDATLRDAFRKMTARSMSEQAHAHLEAEISRTIDEQFEQNVKKLRAEADEPIKAGGRIDMAKEGIILAADDRMGAATVRVDARTRLYEQAQKAAMAAAKTPEEKARIKQATDIFMGKIAQAKNQAELSRTAWERGRNNADMRYLYRMVDLINEATVRDGLRLNDLSLYLDQQRVIETRGLSGSRGQSARQAQLVLDAMKARLGNDFAKIEAFARKFHAIHEQELLDNPLLEKVLGKGTAEYWRSQASYVTTKRTFSPEELAEIEAARRTLAASGAAGGDTVVGQMFNYCGRPKATSKLKGSFADKQEVMSATFEKVAEVQKFLRRSEYVIRLRDLLQLANVEGVHDFASGKSDFGRNARYGAISYMENGQKRTLVVPREIADGFERQATYDNGAIKLCATVNNLARQLWIDWNPVYWQRNISRNIGSMEMNMPGMRESIIKRGARFVMPGLAPVTEIAMTHLVRHIPEKMSLPLRKIWGEHTALYYAPKAKRMAMWLTDHNEMQKKLWAAEKRGDLGAVQEMLQDQRDMLDALKANMLVGLSAGKASGTSGFLDDSVRSLGKTMQRELNDFESRPKWRKALDAATWIFRKNSEQQVFEDVMAKFSAYLHDRAQFGSGNNRTLEESGLVVKKNVSIGEGERKGKNTGTVQAIFQPFWNMVEKGVTRSVKAYGERPGETFQKAAWRIGPMLLQGLVGSGAVAAWILKAHDGDEAAAESGSMGDVYRYARNAQRAYQNCSKYVKENYHVTPLWTDGWTSVVIGMPLTDEERLLKPIARFVTDAADVASGVKERMDLAGFMSDATGVIAPDFKMAGALPTLLDDTVHALVENPEDYYTGGTKYDSSLWTARNESWEMRGKFAAAVGRRLWNDFGGRNVLPVERGGVDNGLGRAPGWVAKAVNGIPLASPILRSFVKVQVGSPRKDAAEIFETEKRRNAVIGVLAKELFETARKEGRDISLDTERYVGKLEEWEKRYGFTPDELAKIEAKYLNAWREYDAAQWRADGEREKYRAKAEQLGLDAASIWLDFD